MSKKIRVAIAGVGNCASALVQGIEYYRDADPADTVPGLMHVVLGGYHVGDVEFVAAFDVDAAKVGLDLGKAILAGPNNTIRFAPVGDLGVTVQRGPTLDGLGKYYRQTIEESPLDPVDVVEVLRRTGADVLVAYLPVGSEAAQKHYAQACLDARVALRQRHPGLHCQRPGVGRRSSPMPAFRSSATTSRARLERPSFTASWPASSRIGAWCSTVRISSTWAATWISRTCSSATGWSPRRSPRRRRSPASWTTASKPTTCTSAPPITWPGWTIASGPTSASKAGISVTSPLNVELKLEVWDSPNSAGVVIDALRCAKLAMDRGIGGPLLGPSAYFMKSPPQQFHDDEAHRMVEEFAAG